MSSGCTKVAVDDDNIITVSLYLRRDVPLYQNHRELVCVCLPGCPTSHMSTCLHMSAHVCTCPAHVCACRTAAACPSYGCGHAGTDVKSRPRSARRTSGGRHHPPSPFTHCLTSDQTWEPCLTMIGMERNRILEDKGLGLACLSMKIFRTIIPVSVTCLLL